MSRRKRLIGAGLLLAMAAAAPSARAQTCTASGGEGSWRYDCVGEACTLRPTNVLVENQYGTAEDDAFPFRLVIGPAARIEVEVPADSSADRLEITYSGDVLATIEAGAHGAFAIAQGRSFVDIGRALEGGKRLLLVFVDTSLAVNTAVAALGHDGFAATFTAALAASDAIAAATRDGQSCP